MMRMMMMMLMMMMMIIGMIESMRMRFKIGRFIENTGLIKNWIVVFYEAGRIHLGFFSFQDFF